MGKHLKQHQLKLERCLDKYTSDQNKFGDKISHLYSQILFGYFSEYLLVKRGTIQSATCKLCHETLSEHYHEILHCRVLFKVLDHFMPLVLGFHSRNLSDE